MGHPGQPAVGGGEGMSGVDQHHFQPRPGSQGEGEGSINDGQIAWFRMIIISLLYKKLEARRIFRLYFTRD